MRARDQNKNLKEPKGYKPFRCICGSLLARLVPQGIELKCRRCKRHIIMPLEPHSREKIEMAQG